MRLPSLVLASLLCLPMLACSAEDENPAEERPAAATPSEGAEREEARSTILQPGRPGEGNETLAPDTTLAATEANEADVLFVRMMVPHHAQALEMSSLARTRAADPAVATLARRIEGAQGPEILTMTSWLQARGVEVPRSADDLTSHEGHTDHEAHDDAMAMSGMLTGAEMQRLARARGESFDRLFLAGMIRHHSGAIEMAEVEMRDGTDPVALELAAEIAAGQRAEIGRMQDIRQEL